MEKLRSKGARALQSLFTQSVIHGITWEHVQNHGIYLGSSEPESTFYPIPRSILYTSKLDKFYRETDLMSLRFHTT